MGALGINLAGLITQLVSFSLLAFLLYKLLYGPITRMLEQRSERIRESLEAADTARREAASSAERVEQEIANARREGQELIAEARAAANRLRDQENVRTRQQVEEMLERAREEIEREKDSAVEEVRSEFAGLAIFAAERIVERSLDEQAHSEIIDRVLEEGLGDRRN